jgi:biopolymer transport protein ExbD
MAGVSSDDNNKLNVELNLVPFIDLLSTLVLFLLVTAVWMQVAAIPAAVKSKGKGTPAASDTATLSIHVTERGYQLEWPAALAKKYPSALPKTAKGHDRDRLTKLLLAAKDTKALASANVSGADGVPYGAVVEAVDTVRKGGGLPVGLSAN